MKNAAGPRSFVPIQIALRENQLIDMQVRIAQERAQASGHKSGHVLDCLISQIGDGTTAGILIVLQEVGHLVLLYARPTGW